MVGITLLTSNAVSASAVEGQYTLSSITYADLTNVPIPEEYFSTLSFVGDDAYRFDMQISNMMWTTINVLGQAQMIQQEEDTSIITTTITPVSISQIGSSRMLPPPEINAVEVGLRTILPETTDMIQQQLQVDDTTTLTFEGTAGSVIFKLEGLLPVE